MKHIILCISGFSGVGKDEFAGELVRTHKAIQTGLADPAKRHMADLYGFTFDQLFGPSHFRNSGDPRYPKNLIRELGYMDCGTGEDLSRVDGIIGEIRREKHYVEVEARNLPNTDPIKIKPGWPAVPHQSLKLGQARYFIETDHPAFFLSPREALQIYCNTMNDMYLDSWVRKGIEIHKQLATMKYSYDQMKGPFEIEPEVGSENNDHFLTCFSDFRHRHEIKLVRKIADTYIPVVIRIRHPKITTPPYNHRSETEQTTIPDSAFDFVVMNDGTLEELYQKVNEIVRIVSTEGWEWLGPQTYLGQ